MSRPNRFILNSDYMSFAQAGTYEVNVVMPAGRTVGTVGSQSKDFNVPAPKGAVPRYLVSYETTVYNMETQQLETKVITLPTQGMLRIWSGAMGYPLWDIIISRKDASTLNVFGIVQTLDPDSDYDSITLKIRISYMYPPNI